MVEKARDRAANKALYAVNVFPAMPICLGKPEAAKDDLIAEIESSLITSSCTGNPDVAPHREKLWHERDFYACVHTPVKMEEALKILAAREAMDKEWNNEIAMASAHE